MKQQSKTKPDDAAAIRPLDSSKRGARKKEADTTKKALLDDSSPDDDIIPPAKRPKENVVIPPWIYSPDSHPYSMEWRMGGGEDHVMAFGTYAKEKLTTLDEKLAYFRKWPPPPRWMAWMANVLFDLEEEEEPEDYSEYLNRIKELGFQGVDEYEQDLEDEKWLK